MPPQARDWAEKNKDLKSLTVSLRKAEKEKRKENTKLREATGLKVQQCAPSHRAVSVRRIAPRARNRPAAPRSLAGSGGARRLLQTPKPDEGLSGALLVLWPTAGEGPGARGPQARAEDAAHGRAARVKAAQ